MNWNSFVDRFDQMTCILSVEKKPDGGCGTIRIATGNKPYLDSLALAAGGLDLDSDKNSQAGGDEFMILLRKTDPGDMAKKIADIKEKSAMFDHVSFSAGCAAFTRSRDIREALSRADARMYEDKTAYYQSRSSRPRQDRPR